MRKAADFLQTSTRNINRWLPKIASRTEERRHVAWREPARLVAEWVREASVPESPPQEYLRARLLAHIEQQGAETNIKVRSQIMAVSIPTYQKRLKTLLSESEGAHPAEDTSRAR